MKYTMFINEALGLVYYGTIYGTSNRCARKKYILILRNLQLIAGSIFIWIRINGEH